MLNFTGNGFGFDAIVARAGSEDSFQLLYGGLFNMVLPVGLYASSPPEELGAGFGVGFGGGVGLTLSSSADSIG